METKEITYEKAYEMATKMLYDYLTSDFGKRIVSDNEHPFKPYVQEQNSHSMAGELFSVSCPGIGNVNMSYYREGWECGNLDDYEVMADCVANGDMTSETEELAQRIMRSWNIMAPL